MQNDEKVKVKNGHIEKKQKLMIDVGTCYGGGSFLKSGWKSTTEMLYLNQEHIR